MKVWEAFFENAFKNMEAEASAGLVFDDRGVSKVRPHRTTTCSIARDRSNRPCFFFKDALTCQSFESFLFIFIFFIATQAQKNVKKQYYGALCGDDDSDDDDGRGVYAAKPPYGGLKRVDQASTAAATVAPSKLAQPVKSATGSKKGSENDPYGGHGHEPAHDPYGAPPALPVVAAAKDLEEEWVKPAAGGAAADPGVLAWFQVHSPTSLPLPHLSPSPISFTSLPHPGVLAWFQVRFLTPLPLPHLSP